MNVPQLIARMLVAIALACSPLPALAQMPAEQRSAIEGVIRDYLLKNPEILQEALQELERRQQEAQKNAAANAVRSERETLLNSPNHVVVGNPKGDVTIVEFYDYNCGFCKRAVADLHAMVKADPNLRVVLKDFPVLGPDSVEASLIAVAAKNQLTPERYWDFHVKLMSATGRITKDRAIAVAREFGADPLRLERDAQAPQTRQAIAETVELGDKLGLTGTPAFVIGDEIVFGAVGEDRLKSVVASVRQCGKAAC